jgi:hypothetical protein
MSDPFKLLEEIVIEAARHAHMDRQNHVRICIYPHIEGEFDGDKYEAGQQCWGVSANLYGRQVDADAQELSVALDRFCGRVLGIMEGDARQARDAVGHAQNRVLASEANRQRLAGLLGGGK